MAGGNFSIGKGSAMATHRAFPGLRAFSALCSQTKSKSADFWIQWFEVPRVLARLTDFMAILDTRPATAGGNVANPKGPEMAINRNFPGLHAFSANFARRQT